MKSLIFGFATLFALLLPSAGYALECSEIVARLDAVIPEKVGDPALVDDLLSPEVAAPQLGDTFTLGRAAFAVQDYGLLYSPGCDECEPGHDGSTGEDCTYSGTGGSQLRAKGSEGRYVYLNPDRAHTGFTENNVTQADAATKTRRALGRLGIPRREIDFAGVEIRDLVLSARALGPNGELTADQRSARAEVHVIYPRKVDGTPVFDSFGRAAVDSEGRVARLHVAWPDFCISEDAHSRTPRSRSELIAAAMANIQAAGACDTVGAVGATVAYVQTEGLSDRSAGSAEDDETATSRGECYVPALVVSVVGPEEMESELAIAGQLLSFSLVGEPGEGGDRSDSSDR